MGAAGPACRVPLPGRVRAQAGASGGEWGAVSGGAPPFWCFGDGFGRGFGLAFGGGGAGKLDDVAAEGADGPDGLGPGFGDGFSNGFSGGFGGGKRY